MSHAFCLGMPDSARVDGLIADLAKERIAIMTTAPASTPAPPVGKCLAAGVVVSGGSDGAHDSRTPYGNGDMLERAMPIGLRNGFRRDEDIELAPDMCTYGGARTLDLENYGLSVGCAADLFHTGGEAPPVDRAVEDARRRETVVAKCGEEGERAPMAMRDAGHQALSAGAAPMRACHVGPGPGLIDEDQPGGIKPNLGIPQRPKTSRPML